MDHAYQVNGITGGSEKFSAGVSGLVKKNLDCTVDTQSSDISAEVIIDSHARLMCLQSPCVVYIPNVFTQPRFHTCKNWKKMHSKAFLCTCIVCMKHKGLKVS